MPRCSAMSVFGILNVEAGQSGVFARAELCTCSTLPLVSIATKAPVVPAAANTSVRSTEAAFCLALCANAALVAKAKQLQISATKIAGFVNLDICPSR